MTLTTHRSGVKMSTMCAARQHQVCPDVNSGCMCACGHTGKYAPKNDPTVNFFIQGQPVPTRRLSLQELKKLYGDNQGKYSPSCLKVIHPEWEFNGLGDHSQCRVTTCPCDCHKTVTIPEPNWATLYVDNPQVNWYVEVTGNWCYDSAIHNVKDYHNDGGHQACHDNGAIVSQSKNRSCQCPCHKYFNSIANNKTSGDTMPVNNLSKKNFRDAVARLAPIMEEINQQIFDGYSLGQQMFGDTVRDAVLGGIVDEINIQVDKLTNSHHAHVFGKYLSIKFPTAVKIDDVVTFMFDTKYGQYKVNLYVDIPTVYWNIDGGIYNGYDYIQFPDDNSIQLIRNDLVKQSDNPKAILQRGIELATKYGMTLDEYSIKLLAEQISAKEPPEHVNETLIGFRSYRMTENGYLMGSHGVRWPSETLTVDCSDFVSHIKAASADWRMAQHEGNDNQHQCGIYIHKDPATCLYEVTGTQAMAIVYAYGVVGDFEKGYRAQHCKIVKLWVFSDTRSGKEITPRLAQGVYNVEKGIIVGAKYSDFLYDKEVAQWAGR